MFEPDKQPRFQIISAVKQNLHAIIAATHPLASKSTLRLRDCARYPLALPSLLFGGRQLIERAIQRASFDVQVAVESNSFEFLKQYVLAEEAVTFQIPIGSPGPNKMQGLVSRPIDTRDMAHGVLYAGHRLNRALPLAAVRFIKEIEREFAQQFDSIF